MTFVLLGRDLAATHAVKAWIEARISLGKNRRDDPQIVEAEQWIATVKAEQSGGAVMQAISVWQPWATLLASGKKSCETRHWPIRHRGTLLIHAAKTWNAEIAYLTADPLFRRTLKTVGYDIVADEKRAKAAWGLPLGAIVGMVNVVDCYPTERTDQAVSGSSPDMPPMRMTLADRTNLLRLSERELAFGDFSPGRFAWLCSNPVTFATPIPYRGAQGLFGVPDAVLPEEYRV